MSILVKQIQALAHHYVRQGSKAHRRLQVGRMIKFVEFIEQTERPHNLHEIGKRHVIDFWKAHRDLAPKTAHAYWLALCVIWEWTDKPGQPSSRCVIPNRLRMPQMTKTAIDKVSRNRFASAFTLLAPTKKC